MLYSKAGQGKANNVCKMGTFRWEKLVSFSASKRGLATMENKELAAKMLRLGQGVNMSSRSEIRIRFSYGAPKPVFLSEMRLGGLASSCR